MIRRPPRSTQSRSSAASDVYKRQAGGRVLDEDADFVRRTLGLETPPWELSPVLITNDLLEEAMDGALDLSLIHISEPTRPY